jgi:soluble lytic murein transglycosylase-like protein
MKINFRAVTLGVVVLSGLVACAGTPQTQQKIARVSLSNTFNPSSSSSSLSSYYNSNLVLLANQAASKYGIDNNLFHALIQQESAWDPTAISPKGARGLTQIMPSTGRSECGLDSTSLYDPALNLQCGAYYFGKLLRQFGNVELALAAYNSGATRVIRHGGIPPIRETQRYVRRIMANWQDSRYFDSYRVGYGYNRYYR